MVTQRARDITPWGDTTLRRWSAAERNQLFSAGTDQQRPRSTCEAGKQRPGVGRPRGPAQSPNRQPDGAHHERTVTEPERVAKAIPFLQVARSVAQPGGRGAHP